MTNPTNFKKHTNSTQKTDKLCAACKHFKRNMK